MVISDFDMTLTRFAYNGNRCPTTHSKYLDTLKAMYSEEKGKTHMNVKHYYPIEIDDTRSVEEKTPLMVEWWTKAHNLLVEQQIGKDQLAEAVRESNAMLREGYQGFFDLLKHHSIPLLIFSAGVGDILEEVIRHNGVFHPNVRVFSNYMEYNEKVEERRSAYVDSYDIVLEKDETLEVPNAILNYITEGK
uniref:5'-nucleotidase, cytosolic IIIB n=1 Tax=Astyanax mexicanus TaxID=7994 RepID=A0A3B1J144_ASTMX